ncbi:MULTISPECIES: YitT family protein [Eubacterium]|mgnify:FL=1|uniref:YitT family protein n=1 Tax=Eubacterium album TaxID=2978477 RepID=A0ABT2LYB0_9FIRM|nr:MULTISPECIES: YitT family protein [unclassified Eubacterium (in: firmicutes)]MCT7398269.1 YitT family protein [Eubacterium sp. LFL-14]
MENKEKAKKIAKFICRYIVITFAACIYAVGISMFLDPNNLAPGGLTGAAVILTRIIPITLGTLIVIMNIPIMILGAWKFGARFTLSTLYTLVVSSAFMEIFERMGYVVTHDKILAALVGGTLMGAGMGLCLRMETTTGGIDIIIKVLRQKYRQVKSGEMYLIIDGLILAAAALYFKDIEVSMYAGVAIVISTYILDKVLYGSDEAKLVYIVSNKRKIIATRMMVELNMGVTLVEGKGAYNMENTEVIMCVMHKQNLTKVRNLVSEVDPEAFMIVSSATEVFGEGFKGHTDVEM